VRGCWDDLGRRLKNMREGVDLTRLDTVPTEGVRPIDEKQPA
jgi:hypothetical protein